MHGEGGNKTYVRVTYRFRWAISLFVEEWRGCLTRRSGLKSGGVRGGILLLTFLIIIKRFFIFGLCLMICKLISISSMNILERERETEGM